MLYLVASKLECQWLDLTFRGETLNITKRLKKLKVAVKSTKKLCVSLPSSMEIFKTPFRGIINDFRGRKACYKQDWINALCSRGRILALTTYIFFASALPVIAFGEQFSRDTDVMGGFDKSLFVYRWKLKRSWKLWLQLLYVGSYIRSCNLQ